MFRFEDPFYLYLLAAIPVLVSFFFLARRASKKAIAQWGDPEMLRRMVPEQSRFMHGIKFGLLLLGLAFLTIAWANPQWGNKREKVTRKGIDLFIALDISQSMLAEDIAPNRLDRAKRFSKQLIDELRNNDIGLVFFAGNAYVKMPLTSDYAASLIYLNSADPDQAATQGTSIGAAIELADRGFPLENKNHKALVLITDGEDHEEEAIAAAEAARQNGLLIYTVAVGTPEGSFVPVFRNGQRDYKKDRSGNPVRTTVNRDLLAQIAKIGGGQSFELNDGAAVFEAINASIELIEKREFEQRVFTDYESYFQYFLGFGLLFLIVEFFLSYRRSAWLEDRDLFAQ
ncbi:MAG: VWA domain-containing protein [Bacteroidota bacterium]